MRRQYIPGRSITRSIFSMETIDGSNWVIAAAAVRYHLSQPMSDVDNRVQSPCIGNCCLDDDLVCLGCFRSLEEIKEWSISDNQRRRIILQNAASRSSSARFRSTPQR